MRRHPGSSPRLDPVPQPPPRQRIVLESAAELRDAMRAEIRQLRAENQRLKAELAGSQRTRSAGALWCGYCSATALEYVTAARLPYSGVYRPGVRLAERRETMNGTIPARLQLLDAVCVVPATDRPRPTL